jgi:hypothetical protein
MDTCAFTDTNGGCQAELDPEADPHTWHYEDCRRLVDGHCNCNRQVCVDHCPDCSPYVGSGVVSPDDRDWSPLYETTSVPVVKAQVADVLLRVMVPGSVALLALSFWRMW